MQLRTFQAADIRSALAAVKQELGPEALVVATRTIPGGLLTASKVEVTAAVEPTPAASSASPAVVPLQRAAQLVGEHRYGKESRKTTTAPRTAALSEAGQKAAGRIADSLVDADVEPDIADRIGALVVRRAGDEASEDALSRALAEHLGERLGEVRDPCAGTHAIVALVGSTGAGKTTTIAKLAAHAALVRRRRVALISVDTYRVGALEQLRAYADLIAVPLSIAKDPASFGKALRAHADAELVLVDTAGRGLHDVEQVPTLAAMFEGHDVRTCLTISATTRRYEIRRILERFRLLAPKAVVLTKLDETSVGGAVVNAAMGGGLALSYVTFGQRVPEDVARADAARLASYVVANGETPPPFTSWLGMSGVAEESPW
jgi:flagellar biosynthesis protein FlhF